jgi:hypothetical protein
MNTVEISGDDRSSDVGSVTCSLRGAVEAGSFQSCALTYTAGFSGIDDTGSLKFVMRYATDAGVPQFHAAGAPNYTTAVASNGAQLQLRYDVKDNQRPWGKTIHVKVLQGYLRAGDTITLTLGDREGGSPGWRMQTFVEETFEIRVLLDRYATYVYERLPDSPTMRIAAGRPTRLVAVTPTLSEPGSNIVVRTRLEDAWGNPTAEPKTFIHSSFGDAGAYTIQVTDEQTGLKAETNPILVGANDGFGRFWADLHGQSEETIGTNSIDDYFRFGRDVAFLDACAHQGNDFQITDAFWEKIQQTTGEFNQPGRFVTFPGWEWSGNTGLGGDRNVLFREEGGIISRSSRALVSADEAANPCSETVEALFDRLDNCGCEVMMFAHVGGRFADLERHREGLETAVEVHSAWGTFEWMLDDAFRNGYRMAIIGNSDGHKGRPGASHPGASTFGSYGGLTCILAEKLDRESVWEAYQSRRVYATTGARIHLDVTAQRPQDDSAAASDVPMGAVIEVEGEATPTLQVRVEGTAAIERVEIRNAMTVLKTVRPYTAADLANRLKVQWQGATVRGRGRQVVWDGGLRVIGNSIANVEAINFHNHEQRCTQLTASRIGWNSLTTGSLAGVIFELNHAERGSLIVETRQTRFETTIAELGICGVSFDLGGVGKQIAAYRLPPAGGSRSMTFDYQPAASELQIGDNPLYVHVVQEDGHRAWSSPIYFVRR